VRARDRFAPDGRERAASLESCSDGRAKNIDLEGTALKATKGSAEDCAMRAAEIARSADAAGLDATFVPRHASYVKRVRTSYHPQPPAGRRRCGRCAPRKDAAARATI
jgi:hypothetical protein